jgi:hypothetical protein
MHSFKPAHSLPPGPPAHSLMPAHSFPPRQRICWVSVLALSFSSSELQPVVATRAATADAMNAPLLKFRVRMRDLSNCADSANKRGKASALPGLLTVRGTVPALGGYGP